MGEVLFYRGLMLAMVVLVLVILYRVINPWVKALCVKLELEGKDVLRKAEVAVPGVSDKQEGGEGDNKVDVGRVAVDDGNIHEVSVLAEECRKASARRKRVKQ